MTRNNNSLTIIRNNGLEMENDNRNIINNNKNNI